MQADMMLVFRRCTTFFRLLTIGIFGIVNVNMQRVTVPHSAASGQFNSPAYPETWSTDVAWMIEVATDHQILLHFLDFSINETDSCNVDIFELHDGRRSENTTVVSWCWDDINKLTPSTYISSSNVFYLRLITKDGYSRKGFKAQYMSVNLQHANSSGEIQSPRYPNTGEVDVAWRIKVDEGYRILLQFLDFGVHETSPCSIDFFELYERRHNTMKVNVTLVGKWCWDKFEELTTTAYISNHNVFYLRLRTKHRFPRTGFKANYSSIPSVTTVTFGMQSETSLPGLTNFSTEFAAGTIPSSKAISESISTEKTQDPKPEQLNSFLGYIIGVSFIALLILCVFFGCFSHYIKRRSNNKDSNTPVDDTELQKQKPIHTIEKETSSFNDVMYARPDKSKMGDQGSFENEGYVTSIPTYGLPNEKKHKKENHNVAVLQEDNVQDGLQEDKNHIVGLSGDVSHLNDIVGLPGDVSHLNDTFDPGYDVPDEQRVDGTGTGIKPEQRSSSLEIEKASGLGEIRSEYTYIDCSSTETERKPFDHVTEDADTDVSDTFSAQTKLENDGLVPDVAYETFDSKEKNGLGVDRVLYSLPDTSERDSKEIVINEAYQSYEAEEEKESAIGQESFYYCVDENDDRSIGKTIEILYDSILS